MTICRLRRYRSSFQARYCRKGFLLCPSLLQALRRGCTPHCSSSHWGRDSVDTHQRSYPPLKWCHKGFLSAKGERATVFHRWPRTCTGSFSSIGRSAQETVQKSCYRCSVHIPALSKIGGPDGTPGPSAVVPKLCSTVSLVPPSQQEPLTEETRENAQVRVVSFGPP